MPRCELFELLGQGNLSCGGYAIHIEEAIEVVAFVLQAAGEQTIAIDFEHAAIKLGEFGTDAFGAGYVGSDVAHAQASFSEEILLAVGLNLGVDEYQGHDAAHRLLLTIHRNHGRLCVFLLILGNVNDHQTYVQAYLGGSQTDALGGIHGFKHVFHECFQFIVHVFDGGAYGAKDRVSVLFDVQQHVIWCAGVCRRCPILEVDALKVKLKLAWRTAIKSQPVDFRLA